MAAFLSPFMLSLGCVIPIFAANPQLDWDFDLDEFLRRRTTKVTYIWERDAYSTYEPSYLQDRTDMSPFCIMMGILCVIFIFGSIVYHCVKTDACHNIDEESISNVTVHAPPRENEMYAIADRNYRLSNVLFNNERLANAPSPVNDVPPDYATVITLDLTLVGQTGEQNLFKVHKSTLETPPPVYGAIAPKLTS